jgi:hypothetical protein
MRTGGDEQPDRELHEKPGHHELRELYQGEEARIFGSALRKGM